MGNKLFRDAAGQDSSGGVRALEFEVYGSLKESREKNTEHELSASANEEVCVSHTAGPWLYGSPRAHLYDCGVHRLEVSYCAHAEVVMPLVSHTFATVASVSQSVYILCSVPSNAAQREVHHQGPDARRLHFAGPLRASPGVRRRCRSCPTP